VAEVEKRFGLPPRDFRLWVSIHEVTHRVQFGAAPWLQAHLGGLIDTYLASVTLDSREFVDQLKRAIDEMRSGPQGRASGMLLLMSDEQRELFMTMQGMMSLLEGHASFVMNEVAREHVTDVDRMRRALAARRQRSGIERSFQKAIGFEHKVKQYDAGEAFVREVVARVGMEGFNRVWAGAQNLPSLAEIGAPAAWVERVVG
jgi:coenzyme F420 biosynthesis associated uncharacterized protein